MHGFGKYFDGKKPIAYQVSFETRGDYLIISDKNTGEEIARWPTSLIYRDPRQNVVIALAVKNESSYLEIEDHPHGIEQWGTTPLPYKQNLYKISGMLIVLTAIIGAIWLSVPTLAVKIAKQIPYEKERDYAKKFKLKDFPQFQDCQPSPEAQAVFKKFIERVYPAQNSKMKIDVHVVKSDMNNAFTLPGGTILLLSHLIENSSGPEELAGILAHEIAHVKERHVLGMILRTSMFALTFSFFGGDFASVFAIDPSTMLTVATMAFDRQMEFEADQGAVDILKAQEIEIEGFKNFFKRLPSYGSKLEFLSTHPVSENRVKWLNRQKNDTVRPVLDNEEWLLLKTYCQK